MSQTEGRAALHPSRHPPGCPERMQPAGMPSSPSCSPSLSWQGTLRPPAQLHYCQITKFCHLIKLYSAGSLYHYTSWTEHSANSQFPLAGGKPDFLGQVLCFCSPAGLQSCWGLSTEPWMQKAAMHWPAQCPEPNHHFSQDLTRTCPWPCFSSRPQHMSHLGSVAPAWKCSPKGSSGLEAPENQTGGTEKSLPRCSPPEQGLMP